MVTSNPVLDVIKSRRSIRKYKPDSVSDDLIMFILEAARWAPSGENMQPWRFIVIRDPETRKKLGELAGKGSGRRFLQEFFLGDLEKRFASIKDEEKKKYVIEKLTSGRVSAFLADAPVLIAICGDRLNSADLPFDCAAAIENMLLVAASLDLGACWVIAPVRDPRDEEKARKLLEIPLNFKVISIISIGYPSESPRPRPREPLEKLVYYEKFGQKGG